jgi:ankyrin repeat protein
MTRHLAIATSALLFACLAHAGPIKLLTRTEVTLVPLRYISDWLGVEVAYRGGTIDLGSGRNTVTMKVNDTKATIGDKAVTLDVAPTEVGGTVYIPLRFVGTALGAEVKYDEKTRMIALKHPTMKERLLLPAWYLNQDGLDETHIEALSGLNKRLEQRFTEQKVDPNLRDPSGWTPLHWAAYGGNPTAILTVLVAGADVNATTKEGWTALHWAAARGVRDLGLDSLVVHGKADIEARTREGDTALHLAAEYSRDDVVKYLLGKQAKVDALNNAKYSPLLVAVAAGRTAVVPILVEQGADLKLRAPGGNSVLHLAASAGNLEMVQKLLETPGIEVDARNDDGYSPLAVVKGPEAATALLEKGADIAWADKAGLTLLHMTAAEGDLPLMALLLEKGANANAKEKDGRTPLFWAKTPAIATALLDKGADPKVVATDGRTALFEGVTRGVAEVILARGGDATVKDTGGWTALHMAAKRGDSELVGLLLDKGAPATAKSNDGVTPLHLAATSGHIAVAQLLLAKGADINAADKQKLTPLGYATKAEKKEMIAFLKARKAKL